MINIQLNQLYFKVGEKISGTCLWNPDSKNNLKSDKLTVGWLTEGRGDKEENILFTTKIEPFIKASFVCQIPPIGPISYDGQLIRIIWEVNVIFSKPKFLGSQEEKQTQVFIVVPRQDI